MHIKFLPHGRGSGRTAAKYLTQELDHKGEVRAGIEVLRGDPHMVGELADSLDFANRYTSGVISWSAEEKPTDAEIQAVLYDFRRVAFGGLDEDRIAYSEVLHREANGAVHVHIFAANVDISTGKAFNLAPPGWEKAFDPVRDHHNYKNGWARPDDPARARTTQPTNWIEAVALRDAANVEPDTKGLINAYIIQRIEAGLIHNRDDIKASLVDAGFIINRDGKDYLSIKDPETNIKIRLKGAFYDSDFRPENALAIEDKPRSSRGGEVNAELATAAREQLEQAIEQRVTFNQKRYRAPQQRARDNVQELNGRGEAEPSQSAENDVDNHGSTNSDKFDFSVSRIFASLSKTENILSTDDRDGRAAHNSENGRRKNLQTVDRQAIADVHIQREKGHVLRDTRNTTVEEIENDRDRDAIIKGVERNAERIRDARIKAMSQFEQFNDAVKSLAASSQNIIIGSESLERGVTKMRENNNNEIEDFKRNINLAEYASSCGYELVKKESSRNCKVMKSGNDKIIITKASDGHDLYFSVHGGHRGSIIDLVQNTKGLNLGQVRQELRPWSGSQYITQKVPEYRIPRPAEYVKDLESIKLKLDELKPYNASYLHQKRGINHSIIEAFGDVVRQDARGNACFLHTNVGGDVTGWETKNEGFTGFSAGGAKGVSIQEFGIPRRAIFFESVIDAMSYHQSHGEPDNVAYISVGGTMSPQQIKHVSELLRSFESVTVATDNDEAGSKFWLQVKEARPDAIRERPRLKDWNDDLRAALEREHERHRDYGMER